MKTIKTAILCIALAGCGGGESETATNQEEQNINNEPEFEVVPLVEVREASNDCVMDANSEDVMYLQSGDYKTDLWNCAEYDFYTDSRVELFSQYISTLGCYKIKYVSISDGNCDDPQLYSSEPEKSVSIKEWLPVAFGWNSDSSGMLYQYDLKIENTGNITAWALSYEFWIDDVLIRTSYFKESTANSLTPGEITREEGIRYGWSGFSCFNGDTSSLCPLTDGKTFESKVVVKDMFGNVLDESLSTINYTR